ncbi:hypothetical protein [uncultured Tateyamaria sp.]|uniref:hypothetical protein n=1 Tax=uncultured Tateyamaria sp. TaxID=455651 RepID=UPI002625FDF0|nr:hypothetical protein [uncultured Tateyamaria sp.]
MRTLRLICFGLVAVLVVYTLVVVGRDGLDLITPFAGAVLAMNWQGQFNVDFSTYLLLSTVWFLWRNAFSTQAWVFAPLVCVGGMLVFGSYLIWLSFRVDGRLDVLLLGPSRVAA